MLLSNEQNSEDEMQRHTKEFQEIQEHFERTFDQLPGYCTKDLSRSEGAVPTDFYNNGQVNALFNAYLSGYSFAKCKLEASA